PAASDRGAVAVPGPRSPRRRRGVQAVRPVPPGGSGRGAGRGRVADLVRLPDRAEPSGRPPAGAGGDRGQPRGPGHRRVPQARRRGDRRAGPVRRATLPGARGLTPAPARTRSPSSVFAQPELEEPVDAQLLRRRSAVGFDVAHELGVSLPLPLELGDLTRVLRTEVLELPRVL